MLFGVGLLGSPHVLHDRISVFHFNPSKISSEVAIVGINDPNSVSATCSYCQSAASYSGRISISLGPGMGLGQRLTQATASSMSLTSQNQYPATSSPFCLFQLSV